MKREQRTARRIHVRTPAALILLAVASLAGGPLSGQEREDAPPRAQRYALMLDEAPLIEQIDGRKDLARTAAVPVRQRIAAAQRSLRQAAEQNGVQVIGSVEVLANAVFILAEPRQAEALSRLPGVSHVVPLKPIRRKLTKAADLVNAPRAWDLMGGDRNAGLGVKIGIIDTGIDHRHPGMQDPTLPAAPGFPKCAESAGHCAYTNEKVIVARSYVNILAWPQDPLYSRPDDLSPRDRVGHGTGVAMIAAGARHGSPLGVMSGVAPRAYLGNYKVFGSPGVNDVTFGDVLAAALEDAFLDGMDVVTFSLGHAAEWAPFDAVCGTNRNRPCDPLGYAVHNAVKKGMAVVAAAGNDGDFGLEAPALSTINSPGTVEGAITVGAVTNAHVMFNSVHVGGDGVPENLKRLNAMFGDGPKPEAAYGGPARDVAALQTDGLACSALPDNSLAGAIALVRSGECSFAIKSNVVRAAGAIGVIVYRGDGRNTLFPPTDLGETAIPLVLIGAGDGAALKSFLGQRPNAPVTLDPAFREFSDVPDIVSPTSSLGPNIDGGKIKPDLVAVGTDLYTATQKYDPNGDMYDRSGYTVIHGTSFAVPMVAGAVALVKQRRPDWKVAQLKSAVVNTASPDVEDFDHEGEEARVTAKGAGKLDMAKAIQANVLAEPTSISFGILSGSNLPSIGLTFFNSGDSPATLRLTVIERDKAPNTQVVVNPSSFTLQAWSQSNAVAVQLTGSLPPPGSYEGEILVEGQGVSVPLRIPYLFIVSDKVPYNVVPLNNFNFVGEAAQPLPGDLSFKIIDRYGAPVPNIPVRFLPPSLVDWASERTDNYGIAAAGVWLAPQLGLQSYEAEIMATGLRRNTIEFSGRARLTPAIYTGGIVDAASARAPGQGQGFAPGSYISIFGRGLSDTFSLYRTPYLPLSLAGVSVSFDAPSRGISVPGRLHFVSDGQINVQIPWELQGASSALVKVSIGLSSTALYQIPIADQFPAMFEYREPSTNRSLIAALDTGFRLITTANPARRGQYVQLYVNGLGPVDHQPPSGELNPSEPLARTRVLPVVTVGGRPADVEFSGLAPYNIGLYQINIKIPNDAPSGYQPVIVTSNGIASKAATLPVE